MQMSTNHMSNVGPGSTGNVIAALVSLFIPGLGQLIQGRLLAALFVFLAAGGLWIITFGWLGWLGHLLACLEAASYRSR
jgi:TM2 domain-containing membrane protein YozV